MKKTSLLIVGALVFSICFLPAPAAIGWYGGHGYGHGHGYGYGYGGVFWGFGAGLLTGYLVAPRPVYVAPVYIAPPVYASPPPVVYVPPPPPPAPPVSGYTQSPPPDVASAPPPAAQNKCREWKMIERRFEDRWDSYNGRWQTVPIEKWGWVEVPCTH